MDDFEDHIISSWKQNVKAWHRAIKNSEIKSRVNASNQSIVESILKLAPESVLDIGCGEGWLTRSLEGKGIKCVGIDAVPDLLEIAKSYKIGQFHHFSYNELCSVYLKERFDICVCNFSLLGQESTEDVFKAVPRFLRSSGRFIIQTLHPDNIKDGKGVYSGWMEGNWKGFNEEFRDPYPWYFRSMEAWKDLFQKYNMRLLEVKDVLNPMDRKVVSIIFLAEMQ